MPNARVASKRQEPLLRTFGRVWAKATAGEDQLAFEADCTIREAFPRRCHNDRFAFALGYRHVLKFSAMRGHQAAR